VVYLEFRVCCLGFKKKWIPACAGMTIEEGGQGTKEEKLVSRIRYDR